MWRRFPQWSSCVVTVKQTLVAVADSHHLPKLDYVSRPSLRDTAECFKADIASNDNAQVLSCPCPIYLQEAGTRRLHRTGSRLQIWRQSRCLVLEGCLHRLAEATSWAQGGRPIPHCCTNGKIILLMPHRLDDVQGWGPAGLDLMQLIWWELELSIFYLSMR